MNKTEKIEMFIDAMNKAMTTNTHISPIENKRLKTTTGKGIDTGSHGKATEITVKADINKSRGIWYKVASNDKGVDFKHKGIKYQVKIGSGSWAYNPDKLPFDFVIYAPLGLIESELCVVIPAGEFDTFVRKVITLKKNSHNGVNIQSWKNSKKKIKAMFEFLSNYPTFNEWFK